MLDYTTDGSTFTVFAVVKIVLQLLVGPDHRGPCQRQDTEALPNGMTT